MSKGVGHVDCRFDEDSLYQAVVGVWGEHGAHADVLRELIKRAKEAERLRGALRQVVTFDGNGFDQTRVAREALRGT